MPTESTELRREMVALLGRIVGMGPLPPDLQRTALEMFGTLMQPLGAPPQSPGGAPTRLAEMQAAAGPSADAGTVGTRRLVYVHGVCRHVSHFSDPWWDALHPFVPVAFGAGVLGQTRLEVIWSDIVTQASASFAAAGGLGQPAAAMATEQDRRRTAEEIKESLRDRADQQVLSAAVRADGLAAGPMPSADIGGLISIPGLDCIEDFSIYLVNDGVRQEIINRFLEITRPELQAGHELDIIAHSWGTVVAYEGLRQLEDEGLAPPLVRNLFTVGAALSIGPVKLRLRQANRDGKKPGSVRRWVNLNAHGDLIGGPLQGRPYAVDLDFVNLEAVGCKSFLGVVNPLCAHGSYFDGGNVAVNLGIFARFIDQT